jgi:hypothetical protein
MISEIVLFPVPQGLSREEALTKITWIFVNVCSAGMSVAFPAMSTSTMRSLVRAVRSSQGYRAGKRARVRVANHPSRTDRRYRHDHRACEPKPEKVARQWPDPVGQAVGHHRRLGRAAKSRGVRSDLPAPEKRRENGLSGRLSGRPRQRTGRRGRKPGGKRSCARWAMACPTLSGRSVRRTMTSACTTFQLEEASC